MPAVPIPSFHSRYGVAEAEICNRALSRLSVTAITDTDTDLSSQASACKMVYAVSRDEMLQYIRPSFAIATALAPIDEYFDDPLDGFAFVYDIHEFDVLKILRVSGKDDAIYSISGAGINQRLFTDEASTEDENGNECMEIKYVKRVEDPDMFDELFKEALAMRIATKVAISLTQKPVVLREVSMDAERAIHSAKMASLYNWQDSLDQSYHTER